MNTLRALTLALLTVTALPAMAEDYPEPGFVQGGGQGLF